MKNLVIGEAPAKSKTIEKYLGKDFEVVSSKGHIRDLAIKGKGGLGVDVDNDFRPEYEISKDKADVVKDLQKKAAKAKAVYLATDPDREGEAISWHLAQVLGLDIDAIDRVVFHEITHDAVLDAFGKPRAIDMDLVRSQETRRILDRLIGFKLSKLLNTKIKSKSAGRVQSVALKLIVEREKEIKAFVPKEYWNLDAFFEKDKLPFTASLTKINGKKASLDNEAEAMAAYNACQGPFTVDSIKKQVRKRMAKPPFITSTLQQEASTKLNFSAKKTMSVAQTLYEGVELANGHEGLITYMRTDSTRLSDVFVNAAKGYIRENYGSQYVGFYKVKNDSNSQDAHEAIRPSSLANTPEKVKQYLTNDQYKLYKMIYKRALASLMAPAKNNTVSVTLMNNGHEFVANGTEMIFDGYLKVYGDYETSKDVILPELNEQEMLEALKLEASQHFTEPPLRYSEARLIKELEEKGIGRPSTYSTIIDTIQARGYVELTKSSEGGKTKVFIPTEQGNLTTEKLDEFFSSIINVEYTSELEKELDEIAMGDRDSIASIRAFWELFTPLLDEASKNMEKLAPEKTGETCPECGHDLVIRVGKYGKFVACSNYPECKYIKKEEKEKPKAEPSGKICPECGKELLVRKSYRGSFLGCSGFPKCRHMETLEGEPIVAKAKKTTGSRRKKA